VEAVGSVCQRFGLMASLVRWLPAGAGQLVAYSQPSAAPAGAAPAWRAAARGCSFSARNNDQLSSAHSQPGGGSTDGSPPAYRRSSSPSDHGPWRSVGRRLVPLHDEKEERRRWFSLTTSNSSPGIPTSSRNSSTSSTGKPPQKWDWPAPPSSASSMSRSPLGCAQLKGSSAAGGSTCSHSAQPACRKRSGKATSETRTKWGARVTTFEYSAAAPAPRVIETHTSTALGPEPSRSDPVVSTAAIEKGLDQPARGR